MLCNAKCPIGKSRRTALATFWLVGLLWATLLGSHVLASQALGAYEHIFAQVALGGGAATIFAVHNPGDRQIEVKADLFRSDGSRLSEATATLSPGTSDRIKFESAQGSIEAGWARLHTSDAPFVVTEFFQLDPNAPLRTGVLPGAIAFQARFYALLGALVQPGFAVANPNSEATQVTVRLLDAPGGSVDFPLPGGNHSARFLNDPQVFPSLEAYSGTVEIVSEPHPVVVLALAFQSRDRLTTVAVDTPRGFFVSPEGFVGIGTDQPGERLHVKDGNILLQSDQERGINFQRTNYATRSYEDPIFRVGRIQSDLGAEDDSPNFRILFSYGRLATDPPDSQNQAMEWPVVKLDSKGIVASVKPPVGPEAGRGSHFEGFIDGDSQPLFRLNSSPVMQLELGPGGDRAPDVFLSRREDGVLAFMNRDQPGGDVIERMRISSAGGVGIGTERPDFGRLHVAGGNDQLLLEDGDGEFDEKLWLFSADLGRLHLRTASDDFTSFDDAIVIQRDGVSVVSATYPTAKVAIGTDQAGAADLYVVGSAQFTEGVLSSREHKEGIAPLSPAEALETLMELEPVSFSYRGAAAGGRQLGFISEDVPELVSTPERKGVRPMDLIAVLTRVVQEQQERILALEEKIRKDR